VGSPEYVGKDGCVKASAKRSHPLRAALRNMISQQKNPTGSVSLSALVSVSAEQVRKAKMSTAGGSQSFMHPTDSSVMKKKEVSQQAVLANMKTYSGWRRS